MKRFKLVFLLIIIQLSNLSYSQDLKIDKVEPPNWWANMKCNKIQLMLYGNGLNISKASFNTDKIKINNIHQLKNDTYAFLDIEILNDCLPDEYILSIYKNDVKEEMVFPVYERNKDNNRYLGFDSEDIIYLITPDRFVNGDTSNDNIEGMRDFKDRSDILRRHGGDIQGIIDKLDYIKNLGFTAIWINPLIENDMDISYHGYAATDLYKIDPRFGSNKLYKDLVDTAHSLGLKIIMDHVSNHVGMYHPWVSNPPTENWFHGTIENHLNANHEKSVLLDSYADPKLKERVKKGWFVKEMPDLDQSNNFVKNYLIQNTLWWIEFAGIDGIREDTYPYVYQDFMSEWASKIFSEYPEFNIVGEVWINDPLFLSYFQSNSFRKKQFDTHLCSITDYGLFTSIGGILNRDQSIHNLYKVLSQDIVYSNPNMLMIFLDNHDVMRLWDLASGDINKYKMALAMLFTLRGIPQIYYGTEIGLPGGNDHGLIRRDMPGGFPGDTINVFDSSGLNNQQYAILNFIKKLTYLRKKYKALSLGELIHFPPDNELYSYIRKFNNEMILVLFNNSKSQKRINLNDLSYFKETELLIENLLNSKTLKTIKKQYVELGSFGCAILKINEN